MIDMKKLFAVLFAALVVVFSAVPALAAKKGNPSPTPSIEYNLIIHKTEGGTGTYTYDKDEDGKHCYIVAKPKKGYRFVKWVIKGKYILEEGDLNSETLTILLRSDGDAWPYFEKEGEPTQPTTKPASSNPSPISPKTGSTVQYFLFALLAVIAVITGALGYKLARSKR